MAMRTDNEYHQTIVEYSGLFKEIRWAQDNARHTSTPDKRYERQHLENAKRRIDDLLYGLGERENDYAKTPKSRESVELTIYDGYLGIDNDDVVYWKHLPTNMFQLIELLGEGAKVRLTLEEV